jgi:hypothetical protein
VDIIEFLAMGGTGFLLASMFLKAKKHEKKLISEYIQEERQEKEITKEQEAIAYLQWIYTSEQKWETNFNAYRCNDFYFETLEKPYRNWKFECFSYDHDKDIIHLEVNYEYREIVHFTLHKKRDKLSLERYNNDLVTSEGIPLLIEECLRVYEYIENEKIKKKNQDKEYQQIAENFYSERKKQQSLFSSSFSSESKWYQLLSIIDKYQSFIAQHEDLLSYEEKHDFCLLMKERMPNFLERFQHYSKEKQSEEEVVFQESLQSCANKLAHFKDRINEQLDYEFKKAATLIQSSE